MIDELTKAWAAGVFDGEGSALIEKISECNYQIVVAVGNTDSRIIDVYQHNWVVNQYEDWTRTLSRRNVITRGYKGNNNRKANKDFHQIRFGYSDAYRLLIDVQPYLVSKGEDVDVVLRAIDAIRSRPIYSVYDTVAIPASMSRSCVIYEILKPFYDELQAIRQAL